MALPLLSMLRAGTAIAQVVSLGAPLSGVLGVPDVQNALLKLGVKLAGRSNSARAGAAEEMVDLMRSRVPQDSGRLYNGISASDADGLATVEASAVRTLQSGKETEDYARFVESGTRAGERGARQTYVADDGFFSADPFSTERGRPVTRTRKVARTHPGTPAQPYFFNSAREVLDDFGEELDALVDAVAAEDGWN